MGCDTKKKKSLPGGSTLFTFFKTLIAAAPDETAFNTEISVNRTALLSPLNPRFSCQQTQKHPFPYYFKCVESHDIFYILQKVATMGSYHQCPVSCGCYLQKIFQDNGTLAHQKPNVLTLLFFILVCPEGISFSK